MTIDRVEVFVPKTPLEQPFRADLVTAPWSIVDGRVPVPTGPGLGIEVRMDTVERYSRP